MEFSQGSRFFRRAIGTPVLHSGQFEIFARRIESKIPIPSLKDFKECGIHFLGRERELQLWNQRIGILPLEFKNILLQDCPVHSDKISILVSFGLNEINWSLKGALKNGAAFNVSTHLDFQDAKDIFIRRIPIAVQKAGQRQGLGEAYVKNIFHLCKHIGVDKLYCVAGDETGAYFWARCGYIPTPESWDALRLKIKEDLPSLAANLKKKLPHPISEKQSQKLDKLVQKTEMLLESSDPRSIRKIIELRQKFQLASGMMSMEFAKILLHRKNWRGYRSVNDNYFSGARS